MQANIGWSFTDDVETFAAHVWELLAPDPAGNTVALTVIESVRAGRRWSEDPMLFGWCGDSPAVAAVLMTPPHNLHLAHVPDALVESLAAALRGRGVRPPGANGECALVDRFAAAWTSGGHTATRLDMRTRLYALDRLRPPLPQPPGRARRTHSGDVDLAAQWWAAFAEEAGTVLGDAEAAARDALGDGRLWFWEDESHLVLSMAGRNRSAAGVSRVGPVYTPPEHRRRGYGGAVTAAVTEDALHQGVTDVVLLPVRDQSVVRFEYV